MMLQKEPHSKTPLLSRRDVVRSAVTLAGATLLPGASIPAELAPLNERMSGNYFPVHDPCIIKRGSTYHVFSTGQAHDPTGLLPWRTSTDLAHWKLQGKVFDAIPQWAQEAVPGTRGLWAPDIVYVNDEYRLYYSCSTFGSNRSVIGLVVNRTLDPQSSRFKWEDRGLVIASQRGDDFNAIDANYIVARDGAHWLSLGSFWSGIKLFPLDPASGKPRAGDKRKYSLASRPVPEDAPGAIEAPFIIEREGYYYLFVSFDYCCRGVSSSYYIVAGRSRSILGPYLGRDGKSMLDGYGTLLLDGDRRFRGPGHQAVLRDAGRDYLVYHTYDAEHDGRSTMRISPLEWSADGWPSVNP
jgi:arabinan endo-1,5-alpha-L-arabinosidase